MLPGNAVLYKPSEYATLTGLHIERVLHAAGVPAAVFAALPGGGEVGAALLAQALDGVFFTGSVATGRRVAAAAGPLLARLQLELGGKDPSYVRDDADMRRAAASLADGAMYNTGQSCCSVERIYVHERIHDAFVEAFLDTVRGFKVGDPTDEATTIGAIARAAQICSKPRWPMRWPAARGSALAAGASFGPATGSSRRCLPRSITRWR